MEIKLSAVVITKNEEKNISKCLESLQFADEVLVIDDCSKDNTRKIAEKFNAIVYLRDLNGNFSEQRNYALSLARGKWVMFVDADEVVSNSLASEILENIDKKNAVIGYYLKRNDVIFNRELVCGETGSARLLRLARRSAGKWRRKVHEEWVVNGKVEELENPLIHFPHQTLNEFLSDVNSMSTLHAKANFEEGKRSTLIKIIFWPLFKFIDSIFLKKGYKDGNEGFVVALVMSLHSFLAWSKMWLQKKKKPV